MRGHDPSTYLLGHVADQVLLRDAPALADRNRSTTAVLLAHIAEIEARGLYRQAAYDSIHAYCVGELRLSKESAFKHIRAARMARQYPAIFPAVADGRLHLSSVVILAAALTQENADDLLAAAANQSKFEVERLVAERRRKPDLPSRVQDLSPPPVLLDELSPGTVAPGAVEPHGPTVEQQASPHPRVTPLSARRFGVQFTIGEQTHELLQYVQALISHQLPSGDIEQVFHRSLKAFVRELEKTRFAASDRPRGGQQRSSANRRHVPALVKRTVWKRDGGQCTFVSETGRRCQARKFLEFDHIHPVARGGQATVEGMRLRCRLCRYRHKRHYAASGFMPRIRRGHRSARVLRQRTRHNQSPSRNARRRSGGL